MDTKPLKSAVRMSPERRLPGSPWLLSRPAGIPGLRWTVLFLWLASIQAGAVGLGDMVLTSPPGQPLEVEIPVEVVTAQELWALQVGVASERTFLRNGLDRAPELDTLSFEIVRGSDGDSVVRMTSPNPLVSSMTVLVEATWLRRPGWPSGRLIRIYSFGPEDLPAPGAQPRPAGAGSLGTYGPVQAGETLWSLASRFSAPGVHPNQVLVAIFEANPRGFGGNMNGIYQGATLRIPEAVQARRLTVEEATAEAIRQLDAWLAEAESRGQPALPEAQGESALAAEATPGADELQAELEDTRQLIETRDEELLALRAQLVAAQAAAQAAEDAAAAARAEAAQSARAPGLRGLWIELNRAASRAVTAAIAIGLGVLLLVGILIGFLLGRRRVDDVDRPKAAQPPAAEHAGDRPISADDRPISSEDTVAAADESATMGIESQLDLARAYVDMGDTARATRTLRAVIKSGNPDQRQQAQSLLQELEPSSEDKKPDTGADGG